MRRALWTALGRRTLRQAVTALVCLAMSLAFVPEVHAAHDHGDHGHGAHGAQLGQGEMGHDHGRPDHHGQFAADERLSADCPHHMTSPDDHGRVGGKTSHSHSGCGHAHCCTAFVLPAMVRPSQPLLLSSFARPANERATGLPQPSFDRPPIASL